MISPLIFSFATLIIIIFQICLTIGLPWGKASMGGKFPGKYPTKMRYVSFGASVFLSFLILVVLSKANLLFNSLNLFSNYAIWFVVLFSFIQIVLHIITPSKIEKIWLPFVVIMFISSFIVALNY